MRKLMWMTIGFAAACALCAWWLPPEGRMPVLCLMILAVLPAALMGRRASGFRSAALVFLGCVLGIGWYGVFADRYLGILEELDTTVQTLTVRTTDYSREAEYGRSVYGRVNVGNANYPAWMILEEGDLLEPGMEITGEFRISLTASKENPVTYLYGEGIFLRLRQTGETKITPAPEAHWLDQIARLRQRIRLILVDCFLEDALPFVQALLLGDTSLLDYETDTDFKISGIRHVVAVSGLHVSILVALLGAVTFRRKYLMVPVGLGTLLLFAALAGFSPSVNRACIMSGLMLLAMLFNREYDGPTALSLAVLVMLVANPLAVSSVGFQLSVASVAGIYCFRRGIADWLCSVYPHPMNKGIRSWLIRGFDTSVSVSLSAMVFTIPLSAFYFGMVSLIGPVTNLLTLWLISGIFYGILGVCGLSLFWHGGAVLLAKLVSWPVRYILWIAGVMADVPLAAVYMQSVYMVAWLVFVYVLLVVFYVSKNRRPGQLLCCGVVGLCIALMASWNEGNASDTRLTVLDVGQGQCILLENDGQTWMVDCGGDTAASVADLVTQTLLSRGITRLDGLILTHLDEDHTAGAAMLLTRMETGILILPPERTELASLTEGTVMYAGEELLLTAGDAKIRIFPASYPGTSNEKSLCILFDTEKCDILITGDRDGFGERMLLRRAEIPDVDVLIAGHHGSKHSTCEELLAAVRPETVCVSVGENNFGHPAEELLERLEKYGCAVYRTDIHGTITIRR